MAGQEPASAPQGGGFRLYARGFRQDATRSRPRLRAVTLGPVAIAVLLLLAWSSSGNGGGAVHRREAAGVAVETPRVESAEPVKTTPAKVQDVATQPDDGGFVPFARRKRPGAVRARSNNKSNNDVAPITPTSSATVAGVDGEDEEEARRSSREEPMVVKAEDMERAKAEAETRERAIAEAGERRKERSETKSPSIAKKVVKKGTAKKAPQSNPKVVIDSEHDHLFEEETPQQPVRVQKPEPEPETKPARPTAEAPKDTKAAEGDEGGQLGFYFQMANEPKATLELIRAIRVHFPDAPMSVTSDAGYDCSAACERYNCVFTREDTTAGMHGGGGVMEYVRRLKRAATAAGTEWIVLLEDDVRVERGVTRWPKRGVDGGGVQDWRWTAPLSSKLLGEIARRNGGTGPSYKNYGLCGGAIVRASALASLPDDLPADEMRSLQKMDDRFGMWNDVTLSALLMLGGHTLAPWDDVKQGNHPSHSTAFVHNDKRWYGVRMDETDRTLCVPPDRKG